MSRWRLLLCGLALTACGGADHGVEPGPSVVRATAARAVEAVAPSQRVASGSQRAPARKRSVDFRVASGDAGSVDPGIEGVGRLVGSAAAAVEQVVDLPDGTRLRLAPQTELWAFEHAQTLLLVSGQVRVSRLPDAPRAGIEPARIATWAGDVEVLPGAEFVLRVEALAQAQTDQAPARFRAQLGLLRGGVVWTALDDHGGGAVQEQQLLASEALPANVGALQVVSAPRADPAPASWERAFRTQPPRVLPTDFDATLDAALRDQQSLHDMVKALLAALKAADLRPSDGATPAGLGGAAAPAERERPAGAPSDQQRALVEHSRRKLAQRGVLLLAAERSLLFALRADFGAPTQLAARAWAQRFAARLAELL